MADDNDTPETNHDDKPAPRRRAPRKATAPKSTPAKSETAAKPTAAKAKAPPKPRSTKRATPRPTSKSAKATDAVKKSAEKAVDKVGGRWGAAIAGGLVAAAGTAALLTLRGSTSKSDKPTNPKGGAHQPDGEDSSKSFEAGIADEGTVPNA